jgi:hypothetical protein
MTTHGRRIIMHAVIATSFACLVALVAVPPLRHHAAGGGWGIAGGALLSVLAGLHYLRSSRSRS